MRVTDLERTLADSIEDMDKISGIEEIISMIRQIRKIDEKKLCVYLNERDKNFLYQKTGWLLETYGNAGIPDSFYQFCRNHTGKSKRYLTKDITKGIYNSKWKLIVPDGEAFMKNGENEDDGGI